MAIPFPKMHIAASVLNRVMNALEGDTQALGLTTLEMQTPPIAPNPVTLGAVIDDKVEQPAPPVGVDPAAQPAAEDSMIENSAMGGSPFDGALVGAADSGALY